MENANNIIPIIDFHGQEGIQAVSARALYAYLYGEDAHNHFSRWAETFITTNEFAVRGEDWVNATTGVNPQGGRPAVDYHLRLDFAKHIALQSRTEKGKEVRAYFIAVERRAREISSPFQIPKTMAEALRLAATALEALEIAKPKVDFYDAVVADDSWFTLQRAAGVLNIPGLGRNNLFRFLKDWEIFTAGSIPYRRFIEQGYFRLQDVRTPVGVKSQPMVSQRGMDFILKQWNKHSGAAV